MRWPIGGSDFAEMVDKHLDFVDKTLFIKEIFDNPGVKVNVITRPRRFGKTLNLSMLACFLAAEVNGCTTQHLFKGLKIAGLGDEYMRHQGKYPVIFISFKDVQDHNYENTYANLCELIANVYNEHYYLLSSPQLSASEKKVFLSIVETNASLAKIRDSLANLSRYLYKHHGVKPWILIDEYDSPIQAGYLHGYYNSIIQVMRGLFGTAFKDNPSVEKVIITGILRVSKESLFSGVNNIKVYSTFNTEYSEHFGFTEAEVEGLLEKANLKHCYTQIRQWYNGYQIGNSIIYNPWSVINCLQGKGLIRLYWANTSGNDLVKHLLAHGDETIKKDLETIIQGDSITALIDENLVFSDLEKNRDGLWSMLFFCGYLKAIHTEFKEGKIQCELASPNQEITALYRDIIRSWLSNPLGYSQYLEFLLSLTEGRVDEFADRLQRYLIETLSIFDTTGREPEKFYHGFVLGMMVSLNETHEVKSNYESGYGRYDVMLIPKDREQLGIILEFKTVREKKTSLKQAAKDALQQIIQRQYAAQLHQLGIHNILQMGLAFRGKHVFVLPELPVPA
jgi:hypothetical protein